MRRSISLGLFASIPFVASAQTTPGFPQFPTLSPDGTTIVFAWIGDLWAVPTTGGNATRLTTHPAEERRAAFSPDGATLAFDSDRDGGRNLYAMSIARNGAVYTTGTVRRITTSDRAQELTGWSSDGVSLLFTERNAGIYRGSKMFSVPAAGGPSSLLTPAFGVGPRDAADGSEIIFTRRRPDLTRPKYSGSGAPDVWALNKSTGAFRQVTTHAQSDAEGSILPDGSCVFISTRDGQNNLWRIPKGGGDADAKQLTSFKPVGEQKSVAHGVRDLSISKDGTAAVFTFWDSIYTLSLDKPDAMPVLVNVTTTLDANEIDVQRTNFSKEVTEQALSPDGKTMAVVSRGEVYVRSTEENRPTRRVTSTPGREAGIAWSPDGRVLWFTSDEGGTSELYYATVAVSREDIMPKEEKKDDEKKDEKKEDAKPEEKKEEKPAEVKPAETKPDAPAAPPGDAKPEGDKAADKGEKKDPKEKKPDYGKRWSEALTFTVKKFDAGILPAGRNDGVLGMELRTPTPSPDGRRLILTKGLGDVVLIDLVKKTSRVLWEGWAEADREILWAADSRHIVYAIEDLDFNSDIFLLDIDAETDEGKKPINLTRHPDLDGAPRLSRDGKVLYFLSERGMDNFRFSVYGIYLDQKLETMTAYDLEDYFKKAGNAIKSKKAIDPVMWDDPSWIEKDKFKPGKPLAFDTTNSHLRIRRIANATSGSLGDLACTFTGDRVFFSVPPETPGPGAESTLVSVSYKGDDRKTVTAGSLGALGVSANGERLTFVRGKQAMGVPIAGGKVDTYAIDAPVVLNVKAQQKQKFIEACRIIGNAFYHPTLKGLDWKALSYRYLELAEKTRTTGEFNRVFMMLLGELDGSHVGIIGGPSTFTAPSLAVGCLGIDIEQTDKGWKVSRLLFDSPAGKPAWGLKVGDVITAVEDRATLGKDWGEVMSNTAGRETMFGVIRAGDAEGKVQTIILTPIARSDEDELRYKDEVQQRANLVDKLSGGKLGYLHIRAMSEPSVLDFERDLFAAANGKDGLLIDVRDNGGGSTADILLSSLTAPRHAYTIPRGADPATTPKDSYPRDRRLIYGYYKPISVLINENAFSNAEIFSHAIKTIGRGKLVGTATYGGVISTGASSLVDGTTIRTPFRGWYLPDGSDQDAKGAQPDISVPQLPADDAAGRDAQLEAAVKELLQRK